MELSHSFSVPASLEETWAAFNDIESVATCFPGASVTSVEGDTFKGSCKVKLGPISLLYTGSGSFAERDESAGRMVIEAKGKDKRGNGTAGATVTAVFTEAGESRTDVAVATDLSITGRPAQFGRGVIQDVSDKLLQQFVDCLESRVGGPEPAAEAAASEPAPGSEAGASAEQAAVAGPGPVPVGAAAGTGGTPEAPPGGAVNGTAGAATGAKEAAAAAAEGRAGVSAGPGRARGGAHRGEQRETEALNLGATVLPVLAKAYWRQAAGVLAALVALAWLRRRRRR